MHAIAASYTWVLYAGLAAIALAASWRDFDLRPVGIAVAISCAASNASHYWLSQPERPAAYTVAEALVLSMAFLSHVCGASRMLVALVAVCIVSIGLNVHMTTIERATDAQINLWELQTNLCFGVECLLVIASGLHERLRRPRTWHTDGRARPALHGSAASPTEANR